MDARLGFGVARVENLKDIKFTARRPASAAAILGGAGNIGVEEPDSGHVLAPSLSTVIRHRELEQVDCVLPGETLCNMVSNGREFREALDLRRATSPRQGRTAPLPLYFLSDITMTSEVDAIVQSSRVVG